MKRLLVMLLALVPVLGYAYDVEVDGIYYNLVTETKQATVTKGDKYYSGDIEIPSSIQVDGVEYSVTSIGVATFQTNKYLTSIVIPSSVTSIGNYAFHQCYSLTSIVIPSSVTSIGISAFSGCSMTSIEIPSSVTSIDSWTFDYCKSLTSIVIPSSVSSIGSWAFEGCSSLKTVEIPASVTNISNKAFALCVELEHVYYYATKVPNSLYSNQFDGSNIENATLHVPAAVIDDFKATAPWSSFGTIKTIEEDEFPQCEAPTITYQGGELEFTCATEGAQIQYQIGSTKASNGSTEGGKVAVSTHITITAYATADGYLPSETVVYQLPINPGLRGDVNQDGEVNVADAIEVSNIILEKEGETE